MKKYFNFDDIAYLRRYASEILLMKWLKITLSIWLIVTEDELDKLAYVELIKKTTENMTYLTDDP